MLQDPFGRRFPYVRLSLTDVCNFRCSYCLPNGYQKAAACSFLSAPEILRLVRALAGLGVEKVRLTGGEPTLRRDLVAIAAQIAHVPGIRTIGLTTNGYRLAEQADLFLMAGITALNVSVDSLDHNRFHTITGHDKLSVVLKGVEAAHRAGFERVKINTVLLKGINDHELPAFLRWIKADDLSVRFIELMQTGDNADYFRRHHLSADVIKHQLLEAGFTPVLRAHDAGPAEIFGHTDYRGTVGLIAPYSKDFCASCNRLRITSRGALRLCLFGENGYDLRPLLQEDDQIHALQDKICSLLQIKTAGHDLASGKTGMTPHLASLGG